MQNDIVTSDLGDFDIVAFGQARGREHAAHVIPTCDPQSLLRYREDVAARLQWPQDPIEKAFNEGVLSKLLEVTPRQ